MTLVIEISYGEALINVLEALHGSAILQSLMCVSGAKPGLIAGFDCLIIRRFRKCKEIDGLYWV